MFKPGWYHTGMNSWGNPQIEYFANGPGFQDREFDNGPFKNFGDAKSDLCNQLNHQIELIKSTIGCVKSMKKTVHFKDLF